MTLPSGLVDGADAGVALAPAVAPAVGLALAALAWLTKPTAISRAFCASPAESTSPVRMIVSFTVRSTILVPGIGDIRIGDYDFGGVTRQIDNHRFADSEIELARDAAIRLIRIGAIASDRG